MSSLLLTCPILTTSKHSSPRFSKIYNRAHKFVIPTLSRFRSPQKNHSHFFSIGNLPRAYSNDQSDGDDEEGSVQEIRVPNHWLNSSKALEESEWLRVTLHKWLDDEYCVEATNVQISNVAAESYYKSLMEKRTDLGEILLKMAVELEIISYQESFHGAFSSANAAVNLILQRIIEE